MVEVGVVEGKFFRGFRALILRFSWYLKLCWVVILGKFLDKI